MSALPPLYTCEFCGNEVRPEHPGTWRLITGWVQSRKQGGANAVRYPSAPQAYACELCMKLKQYEAPEPDTLF